MQRSKDSREEKAFIPPRNGERNLLRGIYRRVSFRRSYDLRIYRRRSFYVKESPFDRMREVGVGKNTRV